MEKSIFRIWIKENPELYLINFRNNEAHSQYIPYQGILPRYKEFIGRILIEYEGMNQWSVLDSIRQFKKYVGTELIEYLNPEDDTWEQIQYSIDS